MTPQSMTVHQALRLALEHQQAGRSDQAESICQQILAAHPDHPDAMSLYAMLAFQNGHAELAESLARRSVQVKPDAPALHTNLGHILAGVGQLDAAIQCYQRALALNPQAFDALNNLGNALREQENFDRAIEAFQCALAIKPDFPQAHFNFGVTLAEMSRHAEAVESFRTALRYAPEFPEAIHRLAFSLQQSGHVDEAIATYRQALVQMPDRAETHFNLGLLLLLKGDFANGWKEYEWRLKVPGGSVLKREIDQPPWTGLELNRRSILLYGEQGFGDTIQFCRYVALVMHEYPSRIILGVRPELRRLMQSLDGVSQVICPGDPLPQYDEHCPLMSLPYVLGTTPDSIPAVVPYLHADPVLVDKWRDKLSRLPKGKRIGLCWAGEQHHADDRARSLPVEYLSQFASIPGMTWISLMRDAAPPTGLPIANFNVDLHDFAETAALIKNLDLVITVDTAVAHLAGALGMPTWLMLPQIPDWRWMLGREDSAWYPTMRLFRQRDSGDYADPVKRMIELLR